MTASHLTPMAGLYWHIRRELWECRYVWMIPALVAASSLVYFLVKIQNMPDAVRQFEQANAYSSAYQFMEYLHLLPFYTIVSGIISSCLYCAEAIHSERRDRSSWFWRTMPVSDATAVSAKFAIPLLIQPILVGSFALLSFALAWFAGTHIFDGKNIRIFSDWFNQLMQQMGPSIFYGTMTTAIWFAPVYAWFLCVSAWARSIPLVWASLLPLGALASLELALGVTHQWKWLLGRVFRGDGVPLAFDFPAIAQNSGRPDLAWLPTFPITPAPLKFASSPEVWLGLALSALFLLMAIRLRHVRELA